MSHPQKHVCIESAVLNELRLICDVKRWRHAWLVIIHVHVDDDVLHDFIKLTKVNMERRSSAWMQVQH